VETEWLTPAGRPRSAPLLSTTISNAHLGKERTLKGTDAAVLERKVKEQLQAWGEQEVRSRLRDRTGDADEDAQETIAEIRGILAATLDVDDRIDWDALVDRRRFGAFLFAPPPQQRPMPPSPVLPAKPFLGRIIPSIAAEWEARCSAISAAHCGHVQRIQAGYDAAVAQWEQARDTAWQNHEAERARFEAEQRQHNDSVADFRRRFEAGEANAVEEYLRMVFERSAYPTGFPVNHAAAYDASANTAVVDLELPDQTAVPDVIGYKFIAAKNESKPLSMKPKEHDSLYDEAVKQAVIRTLHEVFEAVYTPHVQRVVTNGWVTRTDRATGNEVRNCCVSVSAARAEFETLNLAKVDASECLKKLKALTAGPLSQVGPVQPILQFNRQDSRFVEARAVLDGLNSEQNLAEMPWEDFEHLVRELFGRMFSGEGAEVKVTQASRDQGVDAIAFDPDPIRGGKFVIQAKRYTKVVPVSAVRDLYGTMINEGATKGILVTTADFGPDSREFAKSKPLTLINGAHLVFLLEQQGYRVRLDVAEARARRTSP
jgi:restriction system protein